MEQHAAKTRGVEGKEEIRMKRRWGRGRIKGGVAKSINEGDEESL